MNVLKENVTVGFVPPEVNFNDVELTKKIISDEYYFDYITTILNGGLYFKGSLHLYGFCKSPLFHSILEVNEVFRREYGVIAEGKFLFGQDIFANQFAFAANGIVSINAESGDSDFLARDFKDWLELLSEDREYLTGINLQMDWESVKPRLQNDQRLCAKKPFVIGGEFTIDNLYAQVFPKYLMSNANIARQIYGKPDGTKVVFGTTD